MQAWQFPAVPFGQMSPGGPNLLFDQGKVVEQPFSRRCDGMAGAHRLCQEVANTLENRLVLRQSIEQTVLGTSGTHSVRGRQGPAMVLHLIGAEQARAKRWFICGVKVRRTVPALLRPQTMKPLAKSCEVGVHRDNSL